MLLGSIITTARVGRQILLARVVGFDCDRL